MQVVTAVVGRVEIQWVAGVAGRLVEIEDAVECPAGADPPAKGLPRLLPGVGRRDVYRSQGGAKDPQSGGVCLSDDLLIDLNEIIGRGAVRENVIDALEQDY